MNFYPHHIGDFNSATRHLSRIERSVYRDLIDIYYDSEAPLALDIERLCRLVIARDEEEKKAVSVVLAEFFAKTEGGWVNDRCEAEIAKYRGIVEAKSAAGKASAAARSSKKEQSSNENSTGVEQVLNGCSTNQDPLTITQEPKDQDQKICAAAAAPAPVEDPKATPEPDQPKASKGTRLAKDWTLPEAWRTWALDARADLGAPGIELEADKFRDHWHAATGSKATKADWLATWRNWVRNAHAPRNVHAFPVKSAFTNLPQVNAAEIRARTAENERLGVRRANF